MRSIIAQLCLGLGLASCHSQPPQAGSKVVIEGNVKNVSDGKVYLADAYYWSRLLNSATSKNGHFRFQLTLDSSFVPRLVGVQYKPKVLLDSAEKYFMQLGYKRLRFHNHTRGPDSLHYLMSAFLLERANVRLAGDAADAGGGRVFAGQETEVLYRLQMQDVGWLGSAVGAKRQARLRFFEDEVKAAPFSHYLLAQLAGGKESFSELELRELLALFNPDVRQSAAGAKLTRYLANRVDANQAHANFTLSGPDGQREAVLATEAKVHLLVFWASWCGPCQQEIPQLKELAGAYAGRGLNLVGVSIDDKKEQWQAALGQEKMSWRQLIADKDQAELLRQQFNFSSIPLVLLDEHGREISRFSGYAAGNHSLYKAALEARLSRE